LHAEISPSCQQNLEPEELIGKILRNWELAAKFVACRAASELEERWSIFQPRATEILSKGCSSQGCGWRLWKKDRTAPLKPKANGTSHTRSILLRIEPKAGHGAGKPIAKQIEEFTDVYSFLFWQLGVRE